MNKNKVTNGILPVILSGGLGERLWPLSNKACPKQFLPLLGEHSLFQETIKRLRDFGSLSLLDPLIICSQDHSSIVTEQLHQVDVKSSRIILEPIGRNTAPAITIAALQAVLDGDDPILLVLPSDHVITEKNAFFEAINTAKKYANLGKLITFGIVPTHPETGYGYIRSGLSFDDDTGVYKVNEFIEKPDLRRAREYLNAGNYFWNSGIFMFRATTLLEEMGKYASDILHSCRIALKNSQTDSDFIHLDATTFSICLNNSIDYVLMEKSIDAIVVSLNAGWSDLGSWGSLWRHSQKDSNGNAITGTVMLKDVRNSYVYSSGRKILVRDLENAVVVDTDDGVLVGLMSCKQ